MRNALKAMLAAATVGLVLAAPVTAADHLDGAQVKTNGAADINDVYVFEGADPANTFIGLTVNPAAGVISGTTFDPAATYVINVDTSGDTTPENVYAFDFAAVAGSTQAYTVTMNGAPFGAGVTDTPASIATGGQLFAGLVDDPFFFDLDGFVHFKAELLAGNGIDLSMICDTDPDANFFAGFNASGIGLEVPDADLGGGAINVWAHTEVGGVQLDRMGKPGINTVFLHTDATKDAFNDASPSGDVADYTDDVAGTISLIRQELGDDMGTADAYGATVAGLLLPDVIGYDVTTAADYGAPLNGRALADDVIDISYGVVTNGALTSDCVANDSAFRAAFPYFAVANATGGSPTPTPTPAPAAPSPTPAPSGMVPNTAGEQPSPISGGAWLLVASALLLTGGVATMVIARQRRRG
jgi:Domain of unknown function (DUF4331)